MNATVQKLKKIHDAQRIEKKDFSLKNLFTVGDKKMMDKTKKYLQEDGSVLLPVSGFASKYVPKYDNDNNPGFHTTVYLKDGQVTGAFSTALLEVARYFYSMAGMDTAADFNKIMFKNDGVINLKVEKIDLEGGNKTTYNFEIVDGTVDKVERFGKTEGNPLLIDSSELSESAQIEG